MLPPLAETEAKLDPPLADFVALIHTAILDDPALTLRDGNLIRDGYNQELDKLRGASRGREKLDSQTAER